MATTLYKALLKRIIRHGQGRYRTEGEVLARVNDRMDWGYRFFVTTDPSKIHLLDERGDCFAQDGDYPRVIPAFKVGDFFVAGLFDDPTTDNARMKWLKKHGWEMIPKKYYNIPSKEVEVA